MDVFNEQEINVNVNTNSETFEGDSSTYGKVNVSVPLPQKEIGINTNDAFIEEVASAASSSQLDTSAIEQFTRVSQSRDSVYSLIDTMCEDSVISAVLETYSEDATETSDSGRIMWAESTQPEISKYVNYLLDSMGVDKNIFKWVNCLCKYGDVYLRLYRRSEYENDIVTDIIAEKEHKNLQEAIKINAFKEGDHYVHYMEMMPNPAEIFELTKYGKSYAYIIAPTIVPNNINNNNLDYNYGSYQFRFNSKDIEIYSPTEFVHGCLEDNSSRTPEIVSIYRESASNDNEVSSSDNYKVRRGQSLFYNVFKVWRELSLLQNSVLLNRITKSSIVRTVQVEVGDMPKESVGPHLQWVKQLFEQKSALNTNVSINEYTNPGPVENNVYIATRQGQGSLSIGQVGGDVNVGQLTDLDYFRDALFGALRIPKQYFGFTDDGAGFNGGQSLSIISSRYAKMIKRIQSTMCQLLTDAVNLMLIDKGLNAYINKFSLKMVPPTTQEEIDRRDNTSSKIRLVSDVMSNLNEVKDPVIKLKILKSMLSEALPSTDVGELIQDEIDSQESEEESITEEEKNISELSDEPIVFDDEMTRSTQSSPMPSSDDSELEVVETETSPSDINLPSPEELGLDFTNSNNPEFS